MIFGKTTDGRNIRCYPNNLAPPGKRYLAKWSGPTWVIENKDNVSCLAPTLDKALIMSKSSLEKNNACSTT